MGRLQLVFFSESGFTERYARWIAEDLEIPCAPFDKRIAIEVCNEGDALIIGAPVHGGELARKRDIERLIRKSGAAHVICFATGVAEAGEGTAARIARASLRDPDRITMHYFTGGFDESRLEQSTKTLLKALRFMLGRRGDLTREQQLLLDRTAVPGDYTDRAQTASLVQEAREITA